MAKKFESIEPLFGTYEAGVKACLLIGGREIIDGGLPITVDQLERLAQIVDDAEHPWMIEYFDSSHPNAARDKAILTSSTIATGINDSKQDKLGIVGSLIVILYFGGGWFWFFSYYPNLGVIVGLIIGPGLALSDIFNLFILGDCTSLGCKNYLDL